MTQSPLLFQNTLIVAPQSTFTGMAALDKHTGKVRWKSAPLGLMSYASPLLTEIDGVAQIVMLTSGKNYHANTIVAGIDPATGDVLWQYRGWKCLIPIPCPTPLGQGRFFLTGMDSRSAIFQVIHAGKRWRCHTVTDDIPCASAIQNPLLYQEHLYVNSASNGRGLCCLDLLGHVAWTHNTTPSLEQGGNLIIADGMLYFTHGKNGKLYLAEANPARYRELGDMQALEPKITGRRWHWQRGNCWCAINGTCIVSICGSGNQRQYCVELISLVISLLNLQLHLPSKPAESMKIYREFK